MKTFDLTLACVGFAVVFGLGAISHKVYGYPAHAEVQRPSIVGMATIVAARFNGHVTRSGEILDEQAYVCATKAGVAHWGEWLKIETCDYEPKRTIYVRNVDLLPPGAPSVVDLSPAAAQLLFPSAGGRARVRISKL